MRIRRRATDVLHHAQAASSSQIPSPAAAAAPPAPAPRSETAAARWVQPPVREVALSMCEEEPFHPLPPPRGGNRKEETKQESDKATGGEEDERSGHEHGRPVQVACSTRAAPKREEEEGRTGEEGEEEEEKSADSAVRVKDEEKAAAMCKKGDGKGWRCKREAQCGYSLCQYHLDKLRSYGSYSKQKKTTTKKKPNQASAPVSENSTAAATHRRGASQQMKKKKNKRRRMEEHVLSTGSGVSDAFYYYSGFGPLWGKRRGDRPALDVTKVPDGDASQVRPRQGFGDAAAVAGGEEDEHDCEASSRGEKPLKSRALSALL